MRQVTKDVGDVTIEGGERRMEERRREGREGRDLGEASLVSSTREERDRWWAGNQNDGRSDGWTFLAGSQLRVKLALVHYVEGGEDS